MSALTELRSLLARQLEAMSESEAGVRDGIDPEELHRFRVAVRRSRALIRASRPLLRDQLAHVDRELRWLGGLSGPVRDLDVMVAYLTELQPTLDPDQAGVEAIIATLERERLREREALLVAIGSDRYRELLTRYAEVLQTLQADKNGVSLRRIAEKEVDRLRSAYAALDDEASDDDLHAVRIRAKHARYAAELAARTEGQALASLASAAREVQDLIGSHQDAVVTEQRIRAVATESSRLAVGRIVELERLRRRDARAALPAAMRRVDRQTGKAF